MDDKENIPLENDLSKLLPEKGDDFINSCLVEELNNDSKTIFQQKDDDFSIDEKESENFEKLEEKSSDENEDLSQSELNIFEKQKIIEILKACEEENVKQLVYLCDSNRGLITNRMRKLVWPKILKFNKIEDYPSLSKKVMEMNHYYRQVVLDVDRSIRRFPPSIREVHRLAKQNNLVTLIMRILIRNPNLHYYQGFHDICVTFLLILGEEDAFYAMNSIVSSHLKLFMEKTTDSVALLLELIPILVKKNDELLFEFLEKAEVGNIYALSWVLTWFAHSLGNYKNLGRLFDLFIVNHEHFCVYLVAALLLYKHDQILEMDCCISEVYPYLNKLVENEENELPFEDLIDKARTLLQEFPPESLRKEQLERSKAKKEAEVAHRQQIIQKHPKQFNRRIIFAAAVCVASVALFWFVRGISSSSR